MNRENKVLLLSFDEMYHLITDEEYNGCHYCLLRYDTDTLTHEQVLANLEDKLKSPCCIAGTLPTELLPRSNSFGGDFSSLLVMLICMDKMTTCINIFTIWVHISEAGTLEKGRDSGKLPPIMVVYSTLQTLPYFCFPLICSSLTDQFQLHKQVVELHS